MSRAFVNEDDQRDAPIVPPRADLPAGVPNYVTNSGMQQLQEEKELLLSKLKELGASEDHEKVNTINIVNIQLQMLESRINSAQLISAEGRPSDEIRFGSTFMLKVGDTAKVQKFQIVGVDEADVKLGKISFISPLARALMHKKVNDSVVLKLAKGEARFMVVSIE
jgi:transcription elongation factor GreB